MVLGVGAVSFVDSSFSLCVRIHIVLHSKANFGSMVEEAEQVER